MTEGRDRTERDVTDTVTEARKKMRGSGRRPGNSRRRAKDDVEEEEEESRRRRRLSLLVKIEGDPLNTQHTEETVFTRESITEEEEPNVHQAQHRLKPRFDECGRRLSWGRGHGARKYHAMTAMY